MKENYKLDIIGVKNLNEAIRAIGLKEIKQNEKRVILLPKDISLFTPEFEVLVEKGLANSLNIQDEEYIKYKYFSFLFQI